MGVVEHMVESIASDVFLGRVEPGEALAPVRKLAARFGVTVPTAQRALARLSELGLIAVRHGSGISVRAPLESVGLSALPLWIRALEARPAEARRVAGDALELRRDMTAGIVRKVRRRLDQVSFEGLDAAVDRLERAAARAQDDRLELARADLAVVRELLRLAPQVAYSSIANVFGHVLESSSALRRAMYQAPRDNVTAYRAAFARLRDPGPEEDDLENGLLTLTEVFDAGTLDRYQALLEERLSET